MGYSEKISEYRLLDVAHATYLAMEEVRHQTLAARMDYLEGRLSSVKRTGGVVLGALIAGIGALFRFLPPREAIIPGLLALGVGILHFSQCYADLKANRSRRAELAERMKAFASAPLLHQPRFILAEVSSYRSRLNAAKEVLACEGLPPDVKERFAVIEKDWEERISDVRRRVKELKAKEAIEDKDYQLINDWLDGR